VKVGYTLFNENFRVHFPVIRIICAIDWLTYIASVNFLILRSVLKIL
jgi:hypothetical protein